MTITLLGFGSIGRRHYANLRLLKPETEFVVADPVVQLSEVTHSSWELALDVGGPIAIIASPTKFHAEQALAAINRGYKAVLVEKPPACKSDEWRRVAEAADEKHCNLAVAFNYRFHPIRDWLLDREAQDIAIFSVDDTVLWPSFNINGYMVQPDQGGVLLTSASHTLDLMCHVLGEPEHVRAYVTNGTGVLRGVDSRMLAEITHAGGRRSTVSVDWSGPPTAAGLQMTSGERMFMKNIWADTAGAVVDQMYIDMMAAFLEYAEYGDPGRMCDGAQGLRVMRLIEAIRKSSNTGRAIDV